jgi:hypothetical protein
MSPSTPREPQSGAFDLSLLEFDKMLEIPEDLNQLLLESDGKHALDADCMDMTWDIPDEGVLKLQMAKGVSPHDGNRQDVGQNGHVDCYDIPDIKSSLYNIEEESAVARSIDAYYYDSSGAAEQTTTGLQGTGSDFDYETSKYKDSEEAKRTRKAIQKRYRERVKTKAKDVEEAILRAREELERLRFENQNLKSRNKAMEQQSEYSEELISGKYGFEVKEKARLKIEGGFFGHVELAASQRGLVAARYMAQYLWTYFSAPSDKALHWLICNMVKDRRNVFCRTFNFGYQRKLKRLLMEVRMLLAAECIVY